MNEDVLFPGYVPREEEQEIRAEVARVAADPDHSSHAVLLYGPGGIGKTSLIRALAAAEKGNDAIVWLDPVDIDDPEYWLLSTLEQRVAEQLDPQQEYFGPYLDYLRQLPDYARPRLGHETIVSHLGRIKRVFVDCYRRFVQESGKRGKTVVMTFDTVEAIRGVYLLYTFTQWMKSLPGTVFILSGRPLAGPGDTLDPIRSELEDPYQSIPVTAIVLGEFTRAAATAYIRQSTVAEGLSADEVEALVLLTGGHPLWLAFAISYVADRGIPEEVTTDLATIRRVLPYREEPGNAGQSLREAFKRRLVTPYREVDFWHETVKRLAVVRQSVSQEIWQQLMQDRPMAPEVANADEAWEMLKQTPWIRIRANGRYVTLHDAVAEELAYRIIPLHDRDQQWRRELWKRAADIYGALIRAPQEAFVTKLAAVDDQLQRLDRRALSAGQRPAAQEATEESRSIAAVADLDADKRELDQIRAIALYYQLLSDFAAGAHQFLTLFEEALRQNDVFLQDRLAIEMQRFLPGAVTQSAMDDIVGGAIGLFQTWLQSAAGREIYLRIGLSVAGYLIDNEQPQAAIAMLDVLPEDVADAGQISRLRILKSNAYMRIPGNMENGLPVLKDALSRAIILSSPDRERLVADAYKEIGFYYRNNGLWREADEAYEKARDAISEILASGGSKEDHENMASINTNWAYLKGLNGRYHEGTSLVESAINIRRRLRLYQQEGISWSVCGEVYRYGRNFLKAWEAFAKAERAFQGQRNWSWLGMIYQEQAICLLQATEDQVALVPERDAIEQCKRLITLALDICRDQNLRGYPSALNRAGRIYGMQDIEAGRRYLKEGIDWARRLSDGWFLFANLVEYAELTYRAWLETGNHLYRTEIEGCKDDVERVARLYEFSDLEGRWHLLQGHLKINDVLNRSDSDALAMALESYKTGFVQLAQGYMGSSGIAVLARQFDIFSDLFFQLPDDVQMRWRGEFRVAWSGRQQCSTLLLAYLEQLY